MFSGLKSSEKPPRHNALPIAALFQGAPDGQCARRNAKLHAAPVSFCARPTATLRIFSAARSMFSGLKASEKRRVTTRFLSPRSFRARQTANARVAARNHTAAPISFCARPTAALRIFSAARSMFSGLKTGEKPPQREIACRSDFVLRASHRDASNIQRRSVDVFRPESQRKTPRHNALPIAALFQGAPDGQCARRSAKPHGRSDFVLRASHRGTSNIQRRSVDVFRPENRRKTAAPPQRAGHALKQSARKPGQSPRIADDPAAQRQTLPPHGVSAAQTRHSF